MNRYSYLTEGHNYTKRELHWMSINYQQLAHKMHLAAKNAANVGKVKRAVVMQHCSSEYAHAARFFYENARTISETQT